MYHDFWLLEEGVHAYRDYRDFLPRKDAPLRIHDELLGYFADTLSWVSTYNPALEKVPSGWGLNWYGPTIINQAGGLLFQRIFTSWTDLLKSGPEQLSLRGSFEWQWPFDEEEHFLKENQMGSLGHYSRLEVDRDWLTQTLTTLATFGEQTATGTFFILHIGI